MLREISWRDVVIALSAINLTYFHHRDEQNMGINHQLSTKPYLSLNKI